MDDATLSRRSALIAEGLERDPATLEAWLGTLAADDAFAVRRALAQASTGGDTLGGISVDRYMRALSEAVDPASQPAARAGERYGPWSLESRLGAGGMGEVWLATRADGLYQGRAAIKLLRTDIDRGLVGRRFAREREVLARLDHPNIARLLDAGLSERDEQPYIVLEFVEGATLLAHAQSADLAPRERVRLAHAVAEAVAYAHGRLVVHRDLKPHNILVTAKGAPKVLDFGIAALLDDEAPAGEGLTRLAGRALTLEYCAPEQLTGAPADVRVDVYSLGVVLYELLSGARPHQATENTRRALEYAVVHQDAKPLDPRRFGPALAAVVDKALARDPQRRYPTMAAFAADLDAWLGYRPVSATTPGAVEKLVSWSRRNRALALATAATIAAVSIGLVASILLAREAREQERIAVAALAEAKAQSASARAALARAESESVRAEREAANAREQATLATTESERSRQGEVKAREAESLALKAGTQARNEAAKSRAVTDFVTGLFRAADPEKSKGEKLSARDLLDAGAADLPKFADQPETRAELERVLGASYNALSQSEKAIPLLAAAARAQESLGRGSPDRARTLLALARAEGEMERFKEAAEHYAEALPVIEAIDGAMGNEVVMGKTYYAFALCKTGKHDECVKMSDALAEDVHAKLGDRDWLYVEAQNGRATAYSVVGRWREMLPILEPLEPLLQKPPPGRLTDALTIRANLAIATARSGNIQGAVARLAPLSEDLSAHLGPENDRTLVHRWFLAEYQRQLAGYKDCAAQYAKLVEIRTRVTGPTHPLTIDVLSKAAICARMAGDEKAARDYLARAEAALPATDNPPQRAVLRALVVLASLSLDLGERDRAAAQISRARAIATAAKLEAADESIIIALVDGSRLARSGDAAAASAQLEAMFATPMGQRALGGHAALGIRAYHLALAGRADEARTQGAAARKLAQARLPATHPYFAVLDYVDVLAAGGPSAPALAAVEKAAGRPASLPLAPLWFTL